MGNRLVVRDMQKRPAPKPATCPGCGASLSWVVAAALRPLAFKVAFRDGRPPIPAFELRCRDCNTLSVVFYDRGGLLTVFTDPQAARNEERELASIDTRTDGRDKIR